MNSFFRWKKGPEFLLQQEDKWPSRSELSKFEAPQDPEIKRVVLANILNVNCTERSALDQVIQHYSDWFRLKKAVC